MPISVITPTQTPKSAIVDTVYVDINHRGACLEAALVSAFRQCAALEQVSSLVDVRGTALEHVSFMMSVLGGVMVDLTPDIALASTFAAWVMNTKTAGVAGYSNFPFTSLFKHPMGYFGITADGLFQLSGIQDDGAQIDAEVLTGISTFGVDQKKAVTDMWMELRGSGDVEMAIIMNETDDPITYVESCDNSLKIDFQRVKPGKGASGSHVQARFRNVDGSDFALQSIRLIVQPKSRR